MSVGEMTVVELQRMQASENAVTPNAADPCEDAVKSEDVPLEILRRRLDLVNSEDEARYIEIQLAELLEERDRTDQVVKKIVRIATNDHLTAKNVIESRMFITQCDCYEAVLDSLEEHCHDHLNIPENDYALRKLYTSVNVCESNIPLETIHSAIEKVCPDDEI